MKQRKFKFSLGIKIASILSCLALVSIGFASWWVISINKPAAASTGSFTVYEVEEKNVNITVDGNNGWTGAEIIFGKSTKTPATTPTWLLANDPNMKNQSLSATLKFNVATDDADVALDELVGGVTVTFDLSTAEVAVPETIDADEKMTFAELFQYAMGKGYIAAPKISGTYGSGTSIGDAQTYSNGAVTVALPAAALTTNSVDVTINFEFGWGSMTYKDGANQNPFDYFNTVDYNTTNKENALAMLTTIDLLGDVQNAYSVTIDATVKGAN